MTDTYALLCARDPVLIEAVEVVAAAQQVSLRLARDADDARALWPAAGVRLVSTEVASRWASVEAGRAYLLGADASELTRCSAGLGLPVLHLPDAGARLADVLASIRSSGVSGGRVVAVAGASGGLGVSTLAIGLALAAAAEGMTAAVVDLAPGGGGLDLLVGAEAVDGMRWSSLGGARGEPGDLAAVLPRFDGVPVVTQDRAAPCVPPGEAVSAVVGALRRSHDVVVLDGAPPHLVAPDHTWLMVGADVRSVAAARMRAGAASMAPTGLIIRRGRGRTLAAAVVGRALGAPVVGTIDEDRALPRLAGLGLPPVGGPARRFTRQAKALAREVGHG